MHELDFRCKQAARQRSGRGPSEPRAAVPVGVILAAGSSSRRGGVPKPLVHVAGVTLLKRALSTLVHTGEVELDGPAIRGIAVHIGARVAAEAAPGDVLVSSTVKDLVAGSGLVFEARGQRELKGVPGAWHLYSASAPESAAGP